MAINVGSSQSIITCLTIHTVRYGISDVYCIEIRAVAAIMYRLKVRGRNSDDKRS